MSQCLKQGQETPRPVEGRDTKHAVHRISEIASSQSLLICASHWVRFVAQSNAGHVLRTYRFLALWGMGMRMSGSPKPEGVMGREDERHDNGRFKIRKGARGTPFALDLAASQRKRHGMKHNQCAKRGKP